MSILLLHRPSSNSPYNLPLPVAIHIKSHRLPFDSCWNIHVLHNLHRNTNDITRHHLKLAYSFCPLDIALALNSDNLLLNFPPSLPLSQPPGGIFQRLCSDVIFAVCSHTFTLFWLRKTSVTIKIFQISFRVFTWACPTVISSIFDEDEILQSVLIF